MKFNYGKFVTFCVFSRRPNNVSSSNASRSNFPIVGTSETCCFLVVTFYDPVFLARPPFDHLLSLGIKFSYKNRQYDSDIIVVFTFLQSCFGPCSVVGIATGYGLDFSGIESRWGRDFPHLFRPALGPTQPPVRWVPVLSRA